MKTRQTLLLGLAGLGFVLAAPTYAGPANAHDGFAVQLAARDNAEPRQESRRDREFREDERGRNRTPPLRDNRDNDRYAPQEYGYGYERRQQPPLPREDNRHRQ